MIEVQYFTFKNMTEACGDIMAESCFQGYNSQECEG